MTDIALRSRADTTSGHDFSGDQGLNSGQTCGWFPRRLTSILLCWRRQYGVDLCSSLAGCEQILGESCYPRSSRLRGKYGECDVKLWFTFWSRALEGTEERQPGLGEDGHEAG